MLLLYNQNLQKMPAPTLSITDNEDGTGATATISGVTGSRTITVSTRSLRSSSWVATATRSGNGTVNLPLASGLYFAYATAVSTNPSSIFGPFAVTSSDSSVYEQIIDAVEAEIYTLANAGALPGFVAGASTVKQLPINNLSIASLPVIFLSPQGPESKYPGNNNRDDWGKPVRIDLCHESTAPGTVRADAIEIWRERLIRHFHRKRLAAVDEVYDCDVSPGSILTLTQVPAVNTPRPMLLSTLTLFFKTREPRTF